MPDNPSSGRMRGRLRTAFTANLALIRSVFMLLCCFADQVV